MHEYCVPERGVADDRLARNTRPSASRTPAAHRGQQVVIVNNQFSEIMVLLIFGLPLNTRPSASRTPAARRGEQVSSEI
jgi:hypothetical protein